MTDTSTKAVETLAAKHASLAAGSEACIDYPRADESMLVHDTLRALLAEREALREELAPYRAEHNRRMAAASSVYGTAADVEYARRHREPQQNSQQALYMPTAAKGEGA